LTIHRGALGDWTLQAANDLTSKQLREGLGALLDVLRGGPRKEIAEAIMELIGATDRPPQLDEEKAAARILALQQMAWDYPIDVVKAACRKWRTVPNYGRWWPTEQDLRAQCEPLVDSRRKLRAQAERLLHELEAKEHSARLAQPSPFAGDKERQFRNEMRKRMTPSRFNAYFCPTQMMFSEREIWVRTQTSERVLTEEGGDLLRVLGLRIRYQPQAFSKIRQPTWEDDTPEERAATAVKFNRLKEALEKGENLKRLREAGVI
jgi:hypothetical protein